MRFFARLKKLTQMVFSGFRPWSWLLPRTSYNYARDVGDGLRSSVLVAVLFWIMRRFAEAKLVIERDEETERDHELLDLIHRPNPFYSGRLLRMASALSYNTDGNVYWIIIRNRQLKPIQLWYVPHWMMEPHWPQSAEQFIDYYSYRPEGREIKIDPEDVVHIRFGLDPNNIRKGLAPLKSLLREIFTDDEAANFTAALLRNFGVPGLIISPADQDAEMEQGTPKEIKEFFRTFRGDARGEPLVMKSRTSVEKFGFSPSELDLSRLRQVPEERVTAVLGVPAAVVGFGTGLEQTKVGATMVSLREAAYEDCIIPMQNVFAEELDVQLLPEFETDPKKVHVAFDLSDVRVLQEDENKHAERVTGLVSSRLLSVAEGRSELGYEVRPEHEIYLQKVNIVIVPVGQNPAEQPAGNNGNGDGDGKVRDITQFKFLLPAGLKGDAWQARLVQAFYADWDRLSGIWEKELDREFRRLGKAAAEAWEQLIEQRGIETLGAKTPQTKTDIDDIYADIIAGEITPDGYVEYGPHYLRVGQQTYDTIETILGLGVNLTDQAEMRIITSGGTRRGLVDLTQQTKDSIYRAIQQAREVGEGPLQVARRIRDQVAAGPWGSSEIRSRVIARTETKFAQNISSLHAYRSADGINALQVVDGQLGPDRSCDICMDRDGMIVSFEEAETITHEEHPNGTLSWTPVFQAGRAPGEEVAEAVGIGE